MGIKKKRTRKQRGGVKYQELDWGYKGEYQGKNCHELKDYADKLNCAKKKFFYHCGPPKGKEFCAKAPSKDDSKRQNYYRKIIIEDCESDSLLCSKTDTDGEPKIPDDMCTYVNVCDDGMPFSHVTPTIINNYGELKATLDSVFRTEPRSGKNFREKDFKKKIIKQTKSQMKKIKEEYNLKYGNEKDKTQKDETKNDEIKEDETKKDEPKKDETKKDETQKDETKKDETQNGGSENDEENEPTTREKYSASEGEKCQTKIKSGKNPFKNALNVYQNYLQEKEALKISGTSLSSNRERDAKASLITQGKIKGLEDCLGELSVGSLEGLKIFEKYIQLDEKLAKYQNRKSIKRISKNLGNFGRSQYKSVKSQRQAFTEGTKIKKKKTKKNNEDDSEFD